MSMKKRLDDLEARKAKQEADRRASLRTEFNVLIDRVEQRASSLNKEAQKFLTPLLKRMMDSYDILFELATVDKLNTALISKWSSWRGKYEYVANGILARPTIHMEVIHPAITFVGGQQVSNPIKLEYNGRELNGGVFVPSRDIDPESRMRAPSQYSVFLYNTAHDDYMTAQEHVKQYREPISKMSFRGVKRREISKYKQDFSLRSN